MSEPTILRKEMVIAKTIGTYQNGPRQRGIMDRTRLQDLVDKFTTHPRQVPIYALGDHVLDLNERVPDGWVEGVRLDKDGQMIISAKMIGDGADFVIEDRIRGASIGTMQAKDLKGKKIGEVLHHVLLTNTPFIKDLPSIAAAASGGEAVVWFSTALEEVPMALTPEEEKIAAAKLAEEEEKDRIAAEGDKPDEEKTALRAKNMRLEEENDELKKKLANSSADTDKDELAAKNLNLEAKVFGMETRTLVKKGLKEGTLKAAWCEGFAGKDSVDYPGTRKWLIASRFYDPTAPDPEDAAFRVLRFAVEHNPVQQEMQARFRSGGPSDTRNGGDNATLSEEEKAYVRKTGVNAENVENMTDETTYADREDFKVREKASA